MSMKRGRPQSRPVSLTLESKYLQNSEQNQGAREQVVGITDIISEGPIQGLVKGGKSIFINNDPLFDDEEIGYAASFFTASGNLSQTTITLHDYSRNDLDYEAEISATTPRNVFIQNIWKYKKGTASDEFSLAFQINYQSVSSIGSIPKEIQVTLTGDFSNVPASVAYANGLGGGTESWNNWPSGKALAYLLNDRGDLAQSFVITSVTSTQMVLKQTLNFRRDNNFAEWVENLATQLRIGLVYKCNAFSKTNKTLTSTTPILRTFTKAPITIAAKQDSSTADQSRRKIKSSGYQLRHGYINQAPIQNLGGAGVASIPLTPHPEMHTNEPYSIIAQGGNAFEIDKVDLTFKYPGGLYMMKQEATEKWLCGAGYTVQLEVQNALGEFVSPNDDLSEEYVEGNARVTPEMWDHLTGAFGWGILGTGDGGPFSNSSNAAAQVRTLLGSDTRPLPGQGRHILSHGGASGGGIGGDGYTSAVAFTHTIDLTKYQPYTGFKLTVRRITESGNMTDDQNGRAHTYNDQHDGKRFVQLGWRGQDVAKWQAIQGGGISQAMGVITEKFNYPHTAMAMVTFDAKSYSSAPKRAYECYGLKVRIPKNYITREEFGLLTSDDSPDANRNEVVGGLPSPDRLYQGFFNGQFHEERVYTDNPAWIYYDMLTNNRYGVGEFLQDSDIDVYSLYRIAKYCDELVPDGAGGFEPRFTCNLYLSKATEVYKVMKDMATIFRGLMYWMDGKLTTLIDAPTPPVYTFNRSNVVDGNFAYTYTGSKTRTNQVVVSWNNPANQYKLEPLFVEDRANIAKTGQVIRTESTAFGCTSAGQAIRYGRWKLWTSINQTEVVNFETALNGVFLSPGDVINIQDNHDQEVKYGGRILDVTYNTATTVASITIDRPLAEGNLIGTTPKLVVLVADAKIIAEDRFEQSSNNFIERGEALVTQSSGFNAFWELQYQGTGEPTRAFVVDEFSQLSSMGFPASIIGSIVYVIGNSTFYEYDNGWVTSTRSITLEELLSRACDANKNPVFLKVSRETRTKDLALTNSDAAPIEGTTTIVIPAGEVESSAEAEAIKTGGIWALKDSLESVAGCKEYKVIGIEEVSKNTIAISAVEYYNEKFDIIENNFTTTERPATFPLEDYNKNVPPPTGLRVIKTPNFAQPGEEITVAWEAPAVTQDGVFIDGYQITLDIPQQPRTQFTAGKSYSYLQVPDGQYTVQVRAISTNGRLSRPATTDFTVQDVFGGNYPRDHGLIKGGSVSARSVLINDTDTKHLKFETNPVYFYSLADTGPTSKAVSLGFLDWENLIRRAGAADSNSPSNNDITYNSTWFSKAKNLTKRTAFVALRHYRENDYHSNANCEIRVINYARDGKLNVDYWYDQLKQNRKAYRQNATEESDYYAFTGSQATEDIWTRGADWGIVTVDDGSARVKGFGTKFLRDFRTTSLIKFSEDQAAHVSHVEDDGTLFIDKTFSFKTHDITNVSFNTARTEITYTSPNHTFIVGDNVNISGLTGEFNVQGLKAEITAVTATTFTIQKTTTGTTSDVTGVATTKIDASLYYRDELDLDFEFDFLIGFLDPFASEFTQTFRSFLTLNPDIDQNQRALIIDTNVPILNYDGDLTTPALTTTYTDITLDIQALGYGSPEIKVTGDGFTDLATLLPGGTGGVGADVGFVPANSRGQRLLQIVGASTDFSIPYDGGSSLDFTVAVRDAADAANTNKQLTKTFKIERLKDGAEGTQGRTVDLTAEDYTILYDENLANPAHQGTADIGGGTNNAITVTAAARNFEGTALFRFEENGTQGQWHQGTNNSSTTTFTVPSTFNDAAWGGKNSRHFEVNVTPKPSGWDSLDSAAKQTAANLSFTGDATATPPVEGQGAVDSISIVKTHIGQTGPGAITVHLENFGHVYSTAADRVVPPVTITGSGSELEVIIGGVVGEYVGTLSNNKGGANDSSLSDGQWYVKDISHDSGLTVGNLSRKNSSATHLDYNKILIAEASANTGNSLDDIELITWTISVKHDGSVTTHNISQTLTKSPVGNDARLRVLMFKRTTTESAPTDVPVVTYNWNTTSLSVDTANGWSDQQPGIDQTNRYVWQLEQHLNDNRPTSGTTTSSNNGWSGPKLIARYAVDGNTPAAGQNARTVELNADDKYVFTYGSDGTTFVPTGQSLAFRAIARNTEATNFFEFFIGDGQGGFTSLNSNGPTSGNNANLITIPDTIAPAALASKIVKVELREGSATSAVVAVDSAAIYGVKNGLDGTNALLGFLTNPVHVLTASNTGAVASTEYANADGQFRVFLGTLRIDNSADCTFSILPGNTTGINSPITDYIDIDNNGNYSVGFNGTAAPIADSTNSAAIGFRATIDKSRTGTAADVTIDVNFKISKSKAGPQGQGTPGVPGARTATGYLYYQQSDSSSGFTGTALNASLLSYDFTTGVMSGSGIAKHNPNASSNNSFHQEPPPFDAGTGQSYYYYAFTATEINYNSTSGSYTGSSVIISPSSGPTRGVGFSGLVTFTKDPSTGVVTSSDGNIKLGPGSGGDYTQIDGGNVIANTLKVNDFTAGQLSVLSSNLGVLDNDAIENIIDQNAITSITVGGTQHTSGAVTIPDASGDDTAGTLEAGTFINDGRIILATWGIGFAGDNVATVTDENGQTQNVSINNAIDINANTTGTGYSGTDNNAITIYDGSTPRVILGKLPSSS